MLEQACLTAKGGGMLHIHVGHASDCIQWCVTSCQQYWASLQAPLRVPLQDLLTVTASK